MQQRTSMRPNFLVVLDTSVVAGFSCCIGQFGCIIGLSMARAKSAGFLPPMIRVTWALWVSLSWLREKRHY
jgi:hypothetical protein